MNKVVITLALTIAGLTCQVAMCSQQAAPRKKSVTEHKEDKSAKEAPNEWEHNPFILGVKQLVRFTVRNASQIPLNIALKNTPDCSEAANLETLQSGASKTVELPPDVFNLEFSTLVDNGKGGSKRIYKAQLADLEKETSREIGDTDARYLCKYGAEEPVKPAPEDANNGLVQQLEDGAFDPIPARDILRIRGLTKASSFKPTSATTRVIDNGTFSSAIGASSSSLTSASANTEEKKSEKKN